MTNTATDLDPRDLRPKGRRAADPEQIRDDEIPAISYGRLCSLLADEQTRLLRAAPTASRVEWARIDGRCQGLAIACSLFSGIDPDDLRRRLSPRDHDRRGT